MREGVRVDVCMNCAGVWFDAGELDTIRRATEKRPEVAGLFEDHFRVVSGRPKRPCPRCSNPYLSSGIIRDRQVDLCDSCRGLWVPYKPPAKGAGFGIAGEIGEGMLDLAFNSAFDLVCEVIGSAFDGIP